jgi:hypothetical protein
MEMAFRIVEGWTRVRAGKEPDETDRATIGGHAVVWKQTIREGSFRKTFT